MSGIQRRAALLASLMAMFGLLAFVTVRSNRPAAISRALARGLTPSAPHFVLPRLDAERSLDLTALRGSVIVINFWASWCIPCREEAPVLEVLWRRYKERGVVMLGVNVQDLEPEAQRFLRETRTTFPQVRDKDNSVYRMYGLTGVPETFFVDRAGRIVRKFPGAMTDATEWLKALEDTLAR